MSAVDRLESCRPCHTRRTRSKSRRRNQLAGFRRLGSEPLEDRRLLDAGGLDPTFHGDGRVLTDVGQFGSNDQGHDTVAYQVDGKVVVVGRSFQSSTGGDFTIVRYDVDGSLDAGFGSDGIVNVDFGGTYDEASAVTLDSQGRIVVGGRSFRSGTNGYDFAVARLTPLGALDTSFDGDGKNLVDFGGTHDYGYGVAVDSSDNVVVAGYVQQSTAASYDFAVARFTNSGSLDSSFDGDGIQKIDFGNTYDIGRDVAVDSQNRIIVAGYSSQGGATGDDMAVARLTSAGALDTSFDGDGLQTVHLGMINDYGYATAVDAQDNVIVSGASYQGATGWDFAIIKLTSNGSLDLSFDTDGRQTVDFGSSVDFSYGVAVDSQGGIALSGYSDQGGTTGRDFAVAKLTPAGALETSFDGDGKQIVDFGSPHDYSEGVAIDGQGNIIAAGYSYQGTGSTHYDFAVTRLLAGGALDTSFDDDGRVLTDVGSGGTTDLGFDTVAYQTDGKVVVAGYSQQSSTGYDFTVVRYNVDGSLDTSFGNGGIATIDFGSSNDYGRGVTLDSQGRVLVVGYSYQGTTRNDVAVARLTTTGTLDASFNGTGKNTFDVSGTYDYVFGIVADSQDNVLISGYADAGGPTGRDFIVAKLTNAGVLDVSFNAGGIRTIDFGSSDDAGLDIAVDSQDNILVSGYSNQGGSQGYDYAVARLTPTGALDGGFDGDGKRLVDLGSTSDFGWGLAVDGQDNVVLTGYTYQGPAQRFDFGAVRLTSSGALDTGFDSDGIQTVDLGGFNDFAQSVAIDSQGNVVLAGYSNRGGATGYDFAVARLTPTGGIDVSFDTDGWQIVDFGDSYDIGQGVTIDNNDNVIVAGYSEQGDPTRYDFAVARLIGDANDPPTLENASFDLAENSPAGTSVGTPSGDDADGDPLTYAIIAGNDDGAFAIDPSTGEITVADASLLDYETTPSFELTVEVTDDDDESATATVTINLLNQASISGVVFVDVNQNGEYDANEPGIDGVTIQLLDEFGNPVLDEANEAITAITSDGGLYLFEDLDPGTYQLFEVDPTGVDDGAEILGTLGGSLVGNDTMQLALDRTDAYDYAFAEIGQQLSAGDTATIGFWHNKHGQALIAAGGSELANWLTTNFGNVFGDSLAGATGEEVADFYRDQLFKQKGKKTAGPAKVDAQFMAVALATYFTSSNLAGTAAASYGFNVTDTGIGTNVVNVGSAGEAFDVADGTDLTIMQLLLATNALTDTPDNESGFAYIYDTNGDGVIDSSEQALRALANEIYSGINEGGDI